jgi:hypothetical protein
VEIRERIRRAIRTYMRLAFSVLKTGSCCDYPGLRVNMNTTHCATFADTVLTPQIRVCRASGNNLHLIVGRFNNTRRHTMRCKDCKHWDDGECRAIGSHDKGFGWKQNPAILFDIVVTVDDDSGLDYRLRTGPEFGCVRFVAPNAALSGLRRPEQEKHMETEKTQEQPEARPSEVRSDVLLERLAQWIVNHPSQYGGDHACRECYPQSDILKNGFVCAYHEATKIAARSNTESSGSEAVRSDDLLGECISRHSAVTPEGYVRMSKMQRATAEHAQKRLFPAVPLNKENNNNAN